MNLFQSASLFVLLLRVPLAAQESLDSPERESVPRAEGESAPVAVCLELRTYIDREVVLWGELTACRIFGRIGVQLHWSCDLPRRIPAVREILVQVVNRAPQNFPKGALAYALPYAREGIQATLFYDRCEPLLGGRRTSAGIFFGHVLAHEIGHVLSGVAAHSETGLMRPRWTADDLAQMQMHLLGFTSEDARFIRDNVVRSRGFLRRRNAVAGTCAMLHGRCKNPDPVR
jgi:hypothetical protein